VFYCIFLDFIASRKEKNRNFAQDLVKLMRKGPLDDKS